MNIPGAAGFPLMDGMPRGSAFVDSMRSRNAVPPASVPPAPANGTGNAALSLTRPAASSGSAIPARVESLGRDAGGGERLRAYRQDGSAYELLVDRNAQFLRYDSQTDTFVSSVSQGVRVFDENGSFVLNGGTFEGARTQPQAMSSTQSARSTDLATNLAAFSPDFTPAAGDGMLDSLALSEGVNEEMQRYENDQHLQNRR